MRILSQECPFEYLAVGGDLARAGYRELDKEFISITVTITKKESPIYTVALDTEGKLVSVGTWQEGKFKGVIGKEAVFAGIENILFLGNLLGPLNQTPLSGSILQVLQEKTLSR